MSLLDGCRHRLYVLRRGEDYGRETEREIRFHLELASLARSGEPGLLAAETLGRHEFGNTTYYREEVRRMTPSAWLDGFRQDLAYAWRGVRRAPGFAITVIATIALGLGANAAMFSLLDHLLVQAPPGIARPGEIRRLYYDVSRPTEPGGRAAHDSFRYPQVRAVIAAEDSALQIGVTSDADSVVVSDGSRRTPGFETLVSANYFNVLGVRPQLGRFFTSDEARIETPTRAMVISDAFWRRAFDADRTVLGRAVRIHNETFTVVGVAPPDFAGLDLDRTDLWAPLNTFGGPSQGAGPWYESFAGNFHPFVRMPANQDTRVLEIATVAIRSVHMAGFEFDSTSTAFSGPVVRALGPMKRGQEITIATRLGGVSLVVLLIAAANVANLLLLRASRRRRETALRRALGVSRFRLARQLVVESTLLVLLGAAAACAVALWLGAALRRLVMPRVHWMTGAVDARTVSFVALAGLAIGIATALAPLHQATEPDLAASLKAGGRDSAYHRSGLRSALLAVQAALCTVLLVGAALFVRSLGNMESIDTGFSRIDNILMVRPRFDDQALHRDELAAALPLVVDRIASLSGVTAAAVASSGPLYGMGYQPLFLPGRADLPRFAADRFPTINAVSPDYFRVTGIAVRRGRSFARTDVAGSSPVAVVGETMAKAFWPNEDAVGKCLILRSRENPCTTVVGVVADAHRSAILERPVLQYYVASGQEGTGVTTLIVRTTQSRLPGLKREIESVMRQAIPTISGMDARTVLDALEPQLRPWRLGATLFSALGVLATIVAAIGIYSVVAYGVSQRTHEMGIRIALGARTLDILDLALTDGLRSVIVGIAIGVALSLALGRLVSAFLFGVTANDPGALIAAATGLCAIALVASMIPGWRAATVSPTEVLRAD